MVLAMVWASFVKIPVLIHEAHADDIVESFPAHRAGIHPQAPADIAWNAFHPFQTADPRIARGVTQFLHFQSDARGDLVAADFAGVREGSEWALGGE